MISLDVKSKSRSQRTTLLLTLHHSSPRAVRIYSADLPWGIQTSIILVPTVTDLFGSHIPRDFHIDDPGPGIMTFKPRETLKGEIDLKREFKDLNNALKRQDVVLFWSYQLEPLKHAAYPRVSGSLLIPHW